MKNLTCVRCGETKAAAEFVNDRTRVSGKFPWCKPCVLESRREVKRRGPFVAEPTLPGLEGERICPGCERPLNGAHPNRRFCSDPCKEKVRRWKTFGLEPGEYRQLIASTSGRCPICRNQVKKWEIDHDHKTGETFGAVCRVCNGFLIAYTNHDPAIAERLVAFLRNPPIRTMFGERRFVGPESMPQIHRMWGWAKANGDLDNPPLRVVDERKTAA